ncbi:hypothetical protein [Micromonospora orduensis]|uniref:hypothetical protein n=1 Tax=Micromonospora orduensis TaxID=1420891 RepID=UPI001FCBDDD0|nr:hypothetical protein [Micromonospora orduensis]
MPDQAQNEQGSTAEAPSVLVLDYIGRRAEAPISALALERHGYRVRYLLEPPLPRALTAVEYADRLWREHGPFGSEVRAVLAYCMAAPIAQHLVASIAVATGVTLPLVVFDGEPATPRSLRDQYLLAADKLGELLDLPESERIPDGNLDAALLRDDPSEAVRRMRDGLLELGIRAATQRPEEADAITADALEISDFYLDWLIHLVAAHNAEWPSWGGPAVQIASRDHPCVPDWPGATRTETVRVDATRNGLLHDAQVASIVSAILEKGAEA